MLLLNCIEDYLCYKMITSQTVLFEAQVKNFFYFVDKLWSVLKIFNFLYFNHPMIYQICDAMMSITTWERVHFWIYLLNHNSLSHQTWSIDRYKQGSQFSGTFWTIWRTGVFQFSNLLQLLNNLLSQDFSVLFFEKVNKRPVKNGKCKLLKTVRSHYIVILIKL